MAKAALVQQEVKIPAPKMQAATFLLRGIAPYVQNKFSAKAKEQIKRTQEAGPTAKSRRQREPKDFLECYEQAIHRAKEGWYGIPANGIRAAMISACRTVGYAMTRAKLGFFVMADGYDADDGTPLVKITKGEPHYSETPVRNESGVIDIRARPVWDPGWEAEVKIRFDSDLFTLDDIANLLLRAGQQVGIGEGRPDSKNSCGMGWGLFEIIS
ncbi:MAG TPA: hypothetical protein PK777_12065 [Thermoguttaceae bacterium]|nr:hypothetical protein [Thermoguttaceae bacterium]HPP53679.1 hypothetical protein [Thermoguttaceae bacterium]